MIYGNRALYWGSPPQVRGKPNHMCIVCLPTGITPAGAGKTACSVPSSASSRDHPRRCGENFIATLLLSAEGGSPPQVRGKLLTISRRTGIIRGSPPQVRGKPNRKRPNGRINRITPAGAGKTRKEKTAAFEKQDHPRRCGENGLFAAPALM